ncbi:MAG: alpha/beta-hydrolase family protein, partial [Arcanobacterium sp.]|nr:alpha/beta-hydrolase family protein [Arcanobacterium sp.]
FEAADFTENKKLGVDGILLTGAPYFNQLRQYFTLNRDAGSTELHPDFASGKTVRFANSLAEVHDLIHLSRQDWGSERVLYLQNPSDPVAWWSPTMAWVRPQWIIDAAPYHAMTWFPVVSNLQMLADMPGSKNVPRGYGHNYGTTVVAGFLALAGPEFAAEQNLAELEAQLLELNPEVY